MPSALEGARRCAARRGSAHLVLAPGPASSGRGELPVLDHTIIMALQNVGRGVVGHAAVGGDVHGGRHDGMGCGGDGAADESKFRTKKCRFKRSRTSCWGNRIQSVTKRSLWVGESGNATMGDGVSGLRGGFLVRRDAGRYESRSGAKNTSRARETRPNRRADRGVVLGWSAGDDEKVMWYGGFPRKERKQPSQLGRSKRV